MNIINPGQPIRNLSAHAVGHFNQPVQPTAVFVKGVDHLEHAGPHSHEHGPNRGHTAVKHDGHTDYLHDGHLLG